MFLYFLMIIAQLNVFNEGKFDPQQQFYPDSVLPHSYNVLHYNIDIEFFPPYDSIAGITLITAQAVNTIDSIPLHLGGEHVIDSLMVNSVSATYTREDDTLYLDLPSTQISGDVFEIMIAYAGKPTEGLEQSFSGFYTNTQVDHASKHWFACFDQCWDKADSGVTITVTVPDNLYPVANGVLLSVDTLTANRHRFNWDHHYPIATYLISVMADQYIILDRNYHGYPLTYYAIPGYQSLAEQMLDSTELIMELFDTLIDTFPFKTEKHAQVHSGGYNAMEQQTCIRYGQWAWSRGDIHAHEIAHSWWGDAVTCISFNEMFINEGTTSYYECLGTGALRGHQGFLDHLIDQRAGALAFDDYYHWPILNSPNPFGTNVYDKGSWFHHMLRQLIGDSLYFSAMKEFYNTYKGGNASTEDLKQIMENYYGQDLDWFFHQWLVETDYPDLYVIWWHQQDSVYIFVKQMQTTGYYFKIPIEFGLWFEDSLVVRGPLWMDDSTITFSLYENAPDSLTVDPLIKLYHRAEVTIPKDSVMIVDDDGGGIYNNKYEEILDSLGFGLLVWDCSAKGLPPDSVFTRYQAIFWTTGRVVDPVSSPTRDKLNFIISSQIPLALFSSFLPVQLQGSQFLSDTLGCIYLGDSTITTGLTGVNGDPVGNNMQWWVMPAYQNYTFDISSCGVGSAYFNNHDWAVVRNPNMPLVFSIVEARLIANQSGYQTSYDLIENIINYFNLSVGIEEKPLVQSPDQVNFVKTLYRINGDITFHINAIHPTRLSVYDLSGRIIRSWNVQGEVTISWRGDDPGGNLLPAGRYFAVLRDGSAFDQFLMIR